MQYDFCTNYGTHPRRLTMLQRLICFGLLILYFNLGAGLPRTHAQAFLPSDVAPDYSVDFGAY
jgi:hypothetical protein